MAVDVIVDDLDQIIDSLNYPGKTAAGNITYVYITHNALIQYLQNDDLDDLEHGAHAAALRREARARAVPVLTAVTVAS